MQLTFRKWTRVEQVKLWLMSIRKMDYTLSPSPDALSRVGLSQGRGHRRPAFTAARTSVIVAARDEIAHLSNER